MFRKVLIADDEPAVRKGMQTIIDWNACGFEICGEAVNGMEAVEKINTLSPDLVVIDIKMPKLSGIDVVHHARSENFTGSIIILSGYSDFAYAQSAISCGVDFYLVKPIDEDELLKAVVEVGKKLEMKSRTSANLAKAKEAVLADILKGESVPDADAFGLMLNGDAYQVAIVDLASQDSKDYESFFALFKRLMGASFAADMMFLAEMGVILLKDSQIVQRFPSIVPSLEKYSKGLKPSSLFIAVGRAVYSAEDIFLSYEDARSIHQKRFFCDEDQTFISYDILQLASVQKESTAEFDIDWYAGELFGYMEALNTREIDLAMGRLYDELRFLRMSPENIRSLLSGIYLRVKTYLNNAYKHLNLFIPTDNDIVTQMNSRQLLYEILHYLKAELHRLTESIAESSDNNVIGRVIHYIDTHYMENLKLEFLAKKFGYNPAYLGKAIRHAAGETFNTYLEKVRIKEAKQLLLTDLKVYEVSKRVGFTEMDSFYKKFKKVTGKNPGEYRKEQDEESFQ